MDFKNYLNEAWNTHASHSEKIFNEFSEHLALIQNNDDLIAMGNLVIHVCGEHLGRWNSGLELLKQLENLPTFTDKESFNRFKAILNLGMDKNFEINTLSFSDQARVLAVTSSALASQYDLIRAEKYLKEAHSIAISKLTKEDPANRSLAITGNNLASALEEKVSLTKEENELMKLAATIARTFWEISGTWIQVERAEYRLANTFLKAGEFDQAMVHAKNCLKMINENGNPPLELFFVFEVTTLIEKEKNNISGLENAKRQMQEAFDKLTADEQSWCKETLAKF